MALSLHSLYYNSCAKPFVQYRPVVALIDIAIITTDVIFQHHHGQPSGMLTIISAAICGMNRRVIMAVILQPAHACRGRHMSEAPTFFTRRSAQHFTILLNTNRRLSIFARNNSARARHKIQSMYICSGL